MKSFKIGDLEIKLPIVLGGMGVGVSLSGLASAIANEGGIGIISAVGVGLDPKTPGKYSKELGNEGFIKEIRKARQLSPNGIIGANIMYALSNFDDLFKIAIDEKLDVVIVGAGLLIKIPETLTKEEFLETKTKIIPKISSSRAAELTLKVWAEKFGKIPQAFVIEGPMAGGHLGFKKDELRENKAQNVFEILDEVKRIVKPFEEKFGHKVSLIVAGGFYTGEDIRLALESGADAVKMATRFVTTYECDADIAFKMQYINSNQNDIVIIDSPVGLPGRAIENDFLRKVKNGQTKPVKCSWKCLKTCDFKKVPYCIAEALLNASIGNLHEGFAFAGQNAFRATKIESVAEVIESLKFEYQSSKKKLSMAI